MVINAERLLNNFNTIGRIGLNAHQGYDRLAFSDSFYEIVHELAKYAQEQGFEVKIDAANNLMITYNPMNADKYWLIGSHLDTVQNGGQYDGALGVFAGIEVLETLRDYQVQPKHGIVVLAFNAEEAGPFGGTFGSRALTGEIIWNDELLKNLDRVGQYPEIIRKTQWNDWNNIQGYLELHIEQGQILEKSHNQIGIVDGIVAIQRFRLQIDGTANHAGTTPMVDRDDAILKMTNILQELYRLAKQQNHPFVMTVGNIQVYPGMFNVIPELAEVSVEIRDIRQASLTGFVETLERYLQNNYVNDTQLIKQIEKQEILMDTKMMDTIATVCHSENISYQIMSSGAGHDASAMNSKTPTAMIFVPSVQGISHSPEEFTKDADVITGTTVLLKTMMKLAN